MTTQLTEHFSLEEMTFSETAQRLGIDNAPNEEQYHNLVMTAQQMEIVRGILGVPVNVTCALRMPAVNVAVGGAPTSSHLDGLACDFKPAVRLSNYAAAVMIDDSDLLFDQLILEYGWIHIGFGVRMRQQTLTKKSKDAPYIRGLVA